MLNDLLVIIKSSDLTGEELVVSRSMIDGTEFSIVMKVPYELSEDRGQVEISDALKDIDKSYHEPLLKEIVDSSIDRATNALYTALVLHDNFIKDGA